MANLTGLQKAWADHYMVCLNQTEAARKAGYSGDDNALAARGSENARNRKVQDYINEQLAEKTIKADQVLFRLSEHATSTIEDFIVIKGGIPYLDFEKAQTNGKLHLVKKINYDPKTGFLQSVELHDAQAALVHLGKAYALFTNRIEQVTWETKALEYIRDGKIKFPAAAAEFGEELAKNLFKKAGVVPVEIE